MTPRLVFGLALLFVSGALAAGCSASSKAPETAGAATAYPAPAAYGQAGYPQQGSPTADTQSPGITYANPAGTPAGDLDRAERALDLAISGQDAAGQPLAAGMDRCLTVCDALASMRRSAEHVCELDTTRCDDAKARIQRAEERARSACPACTTSG